MCRRADFGNSDVVSVRRSREDDLDVRSVITVDSDLDCESSNYSTGPLESRFAGLSLSAYTIANAAAQVTISETHEEYDVVTLSDFINEYYPEIPAKARPYLAVGGSGRSSTRGWRTLLR